MKGRTSCLALTLLVIMTAFQVSMVTLPSGVVGATLYVGGAGPGNHTTIQDAIDSATPGDAIFVYSGTYSGFVVSIPLSIVGEDKNTAIVRDAPAHVIQVTSSWVNISGFNITNNVVTPNANGIYVETADNCSIYNNNIHHNRHAIRLSSSNHSQILDNELHGNDLAAISIWESENVSVESNNISSNRAGINIWYSPNATIRHNNMTLNENEGVEIEDSPDVMISDNIISFGENGIWMYQSDRTQTLRNAITDVTGGAIVTYFTFASVVSNNDILKGGGGISFSESNANIVSGNTLVDCMWGIGLERSTNMSISNNVMTRGGVYLSIEQNILRHWNTHEIDISNTVNGKPVYYWKNRTGGDIPANVGQVILANCTQVTVKNQDMGDASASIEIGYSSNNTIHNNTVADGILGIFLDHSNNNSIINNTISRHLYFGLIIGYSNDNSVYHNNFIDNGNQSGDIGTNSWDNGYPSGGNYWSDYGGEDQKSGSGQNQPGSDGLGDTPYDIFGGVNQDRYPLMTPIEGPPVVTQNEPPTCSIACPAQGAVISGTFGVTGIATDSDGEVQWIEVRVDDGNWTMATGTSDWTYQWNTTLVENGEHTIYARSCDGENYSAQVNVTVSVNNPTPPTDQEQKDDWIWIAIILAVVVAVVLLLIVFMFIRKRKRDREETDIGPPEEPL